MWPLFNTNLVSVTVFWPLSRFTKYSWCQLMISREHILKKDDNTILHMMTHMSDFSFLSKNSKVCFPNLGAA